jgi:hypothetical protein
MDGEREGGHLSVRKSIYPEPDGYLKMRVRDIIAGAIVVSCFALAVLLSQILAHSANNKSQVPLQSRSLWVTIFTFSVTQDAEIESFTLIIQS